MSGRSTPRFACRRLLNRCRAPRRADVPLGAVGLGSHRGRRRTDAGRCRCHDRRLRCLLGAGRSLFRLDTLQRVGASDASSFVATVTTSEMARREGRCTGFVRPAFTVGYAALSALESRHHPFGTIRFRPARQIRQILRQAERSDHDGQRSRLLTFPAADVISASSDACPLTTCARVFRGTVTAPRTRR